VGSLAAFLGAQAAVFHTGLYAYWVSPSSTTGYLETVLYHERIRPKVGPNQVLGIGDSRMGLVRRTADALTPETGYSFGTIAVAGTTPRCWYYMLRDADPTARAYRAIVIALDSYNDDDAFEDVADRESDLNYLAARLGWRDLAEFSGSYHDPERQRRAALGIAFKGLIFKRDFVDFLAAPRERIRTVRQSWRDSYRWFYDFRDDSPSLAGLAVNWEDRSVTLPVGAPEELFVGLRRHLIEPLPPQTGRHSAYMKYWLGRIHDHYRGSPTRLIFLRLPRAPWIRPDLPPENPHASVRLLAREKNVTLLPEHLFDELERPEFFKDEVHLTQAGAERFTVILVERVREILGPAH
jgi:hypothetical protein